MQRVVKIGGASGIGGERMLDDLARTLSREPETVVVHGGSDATTKLQDELGRPARFLESPSGQSSRQTDRTDLEAFAMATAWVNRRMVEALLTRGVSAFGCSGLDGGLVRGARKAAVRAVENGRVRVVRDQWTGRPDRVDIAPLRALQAAGCVPIVAPIAASESGEMLNVDGDRLAALLAVALGAHELVILTNVPGLLADAQDERSLIPGLSRSELDQRGTCARGRMRKKLLGAREALDGGVQRVILGDARRERPLTDALDGVGTRIAAAATAGLGGVR